MFLKHMMQILISTKVNLLVVLVVLLRPTLWLGQGYVSLF